MDETTKAYVAGFLDGDGSVMLQLKPRRDYRYGFQIKATISFYQDRRSRHVLEWWRAQLGVGSVRNRPDGICQYDIEGVDAVSRVLVEVAPYIVAKKQQVETAVRLLCEIRQSPRPSPQEFLEWAERVESYQRLNYSKRPRYGTEDVRRELVARRAFTPVTTEAVEAEARAATRQEPIARATRRHPRKGVVG